MRGPHPAVVGLVLVAGILGTAAIVLTGNDDPADGAPPAVSHEPNARVVTVQVNGRTVSCVTIDPPGEAFAMSCDWTREAS